jgi:hypothetical protein
LKASLVLGNGADNGTSRAHWDYLFLKSQKISGSQEHMDEIDRRRQTMRTGFSALSKMTALSQAGENFRHHFGTSTALLPEIVGATGQQAVMQLGRRLEQEFCSDQ